MLRLMLAVTLVVGFSACSKSDDQRKSIEKQELAQKPNEESAKPLEKENGKKSANPQLEAQVKLEDKIINGSFEIQGIATPNVRHIWVFADNKVSKQIICKNHLGEEYSATAEASATITKGSVKIHDSKYITTTATSSSDSCTANITAGDYSYEFSSNDLVRFGYSVVQWDLLRL